MFSLLAYHLPGPSRRASAVVVAISKAGNFLKSSDLGIFSCSLEILLVLCWFFVGFCWFFVGVCYFVVVFCCLFFVDFCCFLLVFVAIPWQ